MILKISVGATQFFRQDISSSICLQIGKVSNLHPSLHFVIHEAPEQVQHGFHD